MFSPPSLAGFQAFLTNQVQIPTAAWPVGGITASPWPGWVLAQALETVVYPPPGGQLLYTLAVYNLATYLLFALAPDQAGFTREGYLAPTYFAPRYFAGGYFATTSSGPAQTYFSDARAKLDMVQPSTGLIQSTADENTSATVTAMTWAPSLMVDQLAMYGTPWGRVYLAYAQKAGPTIVGVT